MPGTLAGPRRERHAAFLADFLSLSCAGFGLRRSIMNLGVALRRFHYTVALLRGLENQGAQTTAIGAFFYARLYLRAAVGTITKGRADCRRHAGGYECAARVFTRPERGVFLAALGTDARIGRIYDKVAVGAQTRPTVYTDGRIEFVTRLTSLAYSSGH